MSRAVHITTARRMMGNGQRVTLGVWKANGERLELPDCVSLRFDTDTGTRNVKLIGSGQIRKIRDCCIYRINDLEVYL